MAQRVTYHNSRKGDSGRTIRATHNEHEHAAEHIDSSRTAQNKRWLFQPVMVSEGEDFQNRYEQAVYERYFSECLAHRNEKAIKGRHKERVQTMAQFRENPKACPEETLYYLGSRKDDVDPDMLAAVYIAYVEWHREQFPNVLLLSAYLHVDESTPHIHERKVWTATENGIKIIGQEKSLAEMGIERPDTAKKSGRYNNAKMTYTAMCRAKLQELAQEYGLEIIAEPRKASESGKTLKQYQYDDTEAELNNLQLGLNAVQTDLTYANYELDDVRTECATKRIERDTLQGDINTLTATKDGLESAIEGLERKQQTIAEETAVLDDIRTEKIAWLNVRPEPKPPKGERPEPWDSYLQHNDVTNDKGKSLKQGAIGYKKALEAVRTRYNAALAPWIEYDAAYAAWLEEIKALGVVDAAVKAYNDKQTAIDAEHKKIESEKSALRSERAAIDDAAAELERKQADFNRQKSDFDGAVTDKAKQLTTNYRNKAEYAYNCYLAEKDKNAKLSSNIADLTDKIQKLEEQLYYKNKKNKGQGYGH